MLIIAAAQRSGVVVLCSENFHDGQKYCNVAVLNLFNRNSVENK